MADHTRIAQRIQMRTLQRLHGEWVTYQDGEAVIRVKAVRAGNRSANAPGDGEFRLQADQMDWLILSDDLQHNGEIIEPRPGATITPDSADATYEVNRGPAGEAFNWSDTRQVRMRIHTDRIASSDA